MAAQRRVFEILVNAEHDGKSEQEKALLAGMAPRTWRKHRTPEVVDMALAARRATYAEHLPEIDAVLIRKAKEGSLPHMLIAYERIEGWRPGMVTLQQDPSQANREAWDALSPEDRRAMATTLAKALRRRHLLPETAESTSSSKQ